MFVFFVSMFFCGAKFIAKPAGVGAASQVFTPRRFWKLRRSPCGLGDLGLGGFGMVGWMLGVIFWQGMEHLACCLINFFSWGLGTRLKVGVLFFYVFDVCMFFLYISLKISELILWSWDCSDFKSCLYSEQTAFCSPCGRRSWNLVGLIRSDFMAAKVCVYRGVVSKNIRVYLPTGQKKNSK